MIYTFNRTLPTRVLVMAARDIIDRNYMCDTYTYIRFTLYPFTLPRHLAFDANLPVG